MKLYREIIYRYRFFNHREISFCCFCSINSINSKSHITCGKLLPIGEVSIITNMESPR